MPDKEAAPHTVRTSDGAPRSASRRKAAGKPRRSATSYAVWLLSKREYSAAGLRKKLLARGYDAEESSASLRFVQEHNYQSDARYAGMKARSAAHRAGDWNIARQLAQKGIAESIGREEIAELLPEKIRAAQAASAKFARQAGEEGMSLQLSQKVWRYLGYRGFSAKAIKHAVECLKREQAER